MGKISDALEKIDSREELSIVDPRDGEEQVEESILPETPSTIAIEQDASPSKVNGRWDDRLLKAINSNSKLPEIFETLRSTIIHPLDGKMIPQTIMVGSAIPKEGKSFITANLGVSLANSMEKHCLLVDLNLRNPTLAHAFGINRKYGLVDYMRDQVNLAEVVIETSVPKLSILPSGTLPDDPVELMSSPRIHAFVEDVSNRYEDITIIFDSPPMLMAAESIALAGQVDAILMVVRQGKVKKTEVQRSIDVIDKNKILGIVFNDLPSVN